MRGVCSLCGGSFGALGALKATRKNEEQYRERNELADRARREALEREGVELAPAYGVAAGTRTDYGAWLQRELLQALLEIEVYLDLDAGMMKVVGFPDDRPAEVVADARVAKGGVRTLYYEVDIVVKWEAVVDAGQPKPRAIGHPRHVGVTRLWNVCHWATKDEWKHDSKRAGEWPIKERQRERIDRDYVPQMGEQVKKRMAVLLDRLIAKANGAGAICL